MKQEARSLFGAHAEVYVCMCVCVCVCARAHMCVCVVASMVSDSLQPSGL